MADAELEKTIAKINISTNNAELTAEGEVLKFDGFLKVYREDVDDEDMDGEETQEGMLPPLKIGHAAGPVSLPAVTFHRRSLELGMYSPRKSSGPVAETRFAALQVTGSSPSWWRRLPPGNRTNLLVASKYFRRSSKRSKRRAHRRSPRGRRTSCQPWPSSRFGTMRSLPIFTASIRVGPDDRRHCQEWRSRWPGRDINIATGRAAPRKDLMASSTTRIRGIDVAHPTSPSPSAASGLFVQIRWAAQPATT